MNENQNSGQQPVGISSLPRGWSIAVQLVGTFGLAVFLVLYYVLVLQPKEAAKYEELRSSVDRLSKIIEARESLLPKNLADNLENLFIMAVSPQVADLITEELADGTPVQELGAKLEDAIIVQTDLLNGFTREDGRSISEMLTHKIRNSDIAEKLAERAAESWKDMERKDMVAECEEALRFAIIRARMAK
jgi:hypothetical protein